MPMRAVRLENPGSLRATDVPDAAEPGPGEALVAVRRVGVCGTDLHAFAGRQPFFSYPRILGHELGVEVVSVGPGVDHVTAGSTCTVIPYIACGACLPCRRGRPNCCESIAVLGIHTDGGMRERFVVPADALVPHPSLSFDALALVETLAIGAHAVARARPTDGDHAVVVGAGPIGLGVALRLGALGVPTAMLDRSAERLAAARDRFGIAHVVPAADGDDEAIADALGERPTLVFDATGNPASMNAAIDRAAPSGTVVFVGLHQDEVRFVDTTFHKKELTLMASRNATRGEFEAVLADLASGAVDPAPWITHRTSLDRLEHDLPGYTDPSRGVVKAMLEIDG